MNLDYTHSVQEPIAERQCPGEIQSKPRIQLPKGNQEATWSNLDQELPFLLKTRLRGPISQQTSLFCRIVHELCLDWFGAVAERGDREEEK